MQLIEGTLLGAEGTELVRARALRVRLADAGGVSTEEAPPPPGPRPLQAASHVVRPFARL